MHREIDLNWVWLQYLPAQAQQNKLNGFSGLWWDLFFLFLLITQVAGAAGLWRTDRRPQIKLCTCEGSSLEKTLTPKNTRDTFKFDLTESSRVKIRRTVFVGVQDYNSVRKKDYSYSLKISYFYYFLSRAAFEELKSTYVFTTVPILLSRFAWPPRSHRPPIVFRNPFKAVWRPALLCWCHATVCVSMT